MIDMLWAIIWPVALFMGINLSVQAIFSWYFVGKNILDSSGALSMSTQILDDHSVAIMLITMLINIPIMVVLMKKDEDIHGFRTFGQHYRVISFKGFLWLVPLGITMCLGITKLVTLFPIDNIIGSYEEVLDSYNQSSLILRIITLCILVPIGEELVYRGMFYKRLKTYYEKTIAGYIAALLFAVAHMNLVQGLYALFCAVILIFVYEKYNTILAPILLHISANTMALISGEFEVLKKIDNVLIAKVFFMLIELVAMFMIIKVIYKKNPINSDTLV